LDSISRQVNLISEWVVEHKPQKLSNKRYKHHIKKICFCFVSRRSKVRLGGRYCPSEEQYFSNESGVRMEHLDGAWLLSLSDYSVLNLIHPM
jgi:hypothetical protein